MEDVHPNIGMHAKGGLRTSYMQDGEVTRVKLSQTLMHLALRHYENCRIWAMILHPGWPWEVQVRRQERTGWCCSSDGFSSTTGSTFWSADEVSIFFWFTVFHVVVIQLDNIVGSQLMKISTISRRKWFSQALLSFPMPASISWPTICQCLLLHANLFHQWVVQWDYFSITWRKYIILISSQIQHHVLYTIV